MASGRIVLLGVCLGAAFAAWTGWSLMMIHGPATCALPVVRGIARVLSVLTPAIAYVRFVERVSLRRAFGLEDRPGRAVLLGLFAGFAIAGLPAGWGVFAGKASLHLPREFAAWLNGIIGSPAAEEALFRGVVFRVLASRFGTGWGAATSAAAFAEFHAPW